MPSGKTHTRIDVLFLAFVVGCAVWFRQDLTGIFGRDRFTELAATYAMAYLLSTFLLSPDLDLRENQSKKNWGLLRYLWGPYAGLFKHRGISHTPFLGTLTRLIYLLVAVYVVLAVLNALFDLNLGLSPRSLVATDRQLALTALSGICTPDLLHVLTDKVSRR